MLQEFLSLFILLAGFIIGLGAVTVIDLHGFFARKSSYWTEATIRSHKITKPLIWIGIGLVVAGSLLVYSAFGWSNMSIYQSFIILVLVLNGLFLSYGISPYLLKREEAGVEKEILSKRIQNKIFVSFIFSFLGWWGLLATFVCSIIKLIK